MNFGRFGQVVGSSSRRKLMLAALALAGACGPSLQDVRPIPPAPGVPWGAVGKGYYVTQAPDGVLVGGNRDHKKIRPKVTADFEGPPATNDWWSSLIWQYEAKEPYSYEMFPHPSDAARARGRPRRRIFGQGRRWGRQYMFPYERDLVVGLDGARVTATRASRATRTGP